MTDTVHEHPIPNAVPGGIPEVQNRHAPMFSKIGSFLLPFVTICIIVGTAVAIIAYGRGYRLHTDGSLKSTGLMVVQSDPSGASIIIDNAVKTATQATLTLPPGWYNVVVAKEGFQPWSKRIKVQGEVVAKIEALLLPTNPSLTALTTTGVVNPTLSPDGSKLAYVIPESTATTSANLTPNKAGVWVLDIIDKPLGLNRDARQLAKSGAVDFSGATLTWSPDSKNVLAGVSPAAHYLLDVDQSNTALQLISNIKPIQSEWQAIKEQRQNEQFVTVPEVFTAVASTSARLLTFSPDETKILYEATASATLPPVITPPLIGTNPTEEQRELAAGTVYVYDIKEDRNYAVAKAGALVPSPAAKTKTPAAPDLSGVLHWLPSSKHLVIAGKDKVEIMDYDGANRRTAYAGPFWDSFAVPWASGGKVVILTNLNSTASAVNNLYVINLR